MENHFKNTTLSFIFVLAILPLSLCLNVGFYNKSCPNAESIIQQVVRQRFNVDRSVTAALLRMHFHDCFVRGCDASLLIDSSETNQAEKAAGVNLSIREFNLIDQIKSQLEASCPQTVSCADIIALATRDAIALAGGPTYKVPTGRIDGRVSRASEVNLPFPSMTVSQAIRAFNAKGLSRSEMISLMGGHTVGAARCNLFQDRIANFRGTGAPDPTMDKGMVTKLKRICRPSSRGSPSAFLDQKTSFVFDNEYYKQITMKRGLLKIDQELALDPLSSDFVSNLARNSTFFQQSFVNAIIKMGKIKERTAGEIRKNCRFISKNNGN